MQNNDIALLGLNTSEYKVLKFLTTHGQTLASLSAVSKISRSTLLHALCNLKKRGLITYYRKGKRKYWTLEESQTLEDKINKLSNSLKINEKGVFKYIPAQETEVIIHRGKYNLLKIFERFSSQNKDSRLLGIQPNKSYMTILKKLPPKETIRINTAIKKNKIIVEGILQDNFYTVAHSVVKDDPKMEEELLRSYEGRAADTSVLPKELIDYNSEILIFEDRITLNNWQEEFSVEIRNKEMLGLFKDIFALVKESGHKVDQGAIYKALIDKTK